MVALDLLKIELFCVFLGGLLGVSSFRKAFHARSRCSRVTRAIVGLGDTRYRDVNIAAHQLLEGINR